METKQNQLVYSSILSVAGELAKSGIGKDRKNTQQNYMFRGIDDLYNELAPLLVKHNLIILPNHLTRNVSERLNKNGDGLIFTIVLETEFTFLNTIDGSSHTIKIFGEAMDSSDKATNKAMSVAYKYAMIQAFCIPIVGEENEADAHSPQAKTLPVQVHNKPVTKPSAPQTKQAEVKQLQPFTEEKYQKLLELHETDPTLLDKLQDHYRIGQEWKERFYQDTNKIWK